MKLKSFGLPETFPPHMMPLKARLFVAECTPGMSKEAILILAAGKGLSPIWKPLPHMGKDIYGLGIDVDGMAVPLMCKMESE